MKNKKAISLIVLVITIIVMIILASAIIMSLDNTNIFNKAEEAVDKTNAATEKYVDEIKLAERKLENMSEAEKVTDSNPGVLSGEGTEKNPYMIESIEDLVAFSESVTGGKTYEGQTVKLTRKLDFNSDNSYADPNSGLKEQMTTGEGFVSIGTYEKMFKGTFDGDYYEIQNLYINSSDNKDIGFFRYIDGATIKNIGLTGKITAKSNTASLICMAVGEYSLANCYSKVNINVDNLSAYVGGIICHAYPEKGQTGIIYNCYNEGNIVTNAEYIGGIGADLLWTNMDRCHNSGNITTYGLVCPIIGGLAYDLIGDIKNSYNDGNITSEGMIGGILFYHRGTMENVYNVSNISWSGSEEGSWAAGIISDNTEESNSSIINVYNLGLISGYGSNEYEIAQSASGKIENVYCTNTNIAIENGDYTGTPTIKTLEYMKSQAFVDELNSNIEGRDDLVKWKMGPKGYPILDM